MFIKCVNLLVDMARQLGQVFCKDFHLPSPQIVLYQFHNSFHPKICKVPASTSLVCTVPFRSHCLRASNLIQMLQIIYHVYEEHP